MLPDALNKTDQPFQEPLVAEHVLVTDHEQRLEANRPG